jgi:hypothetical protein
MYGHKRDKILGFLRNLLNEELHKLYSSPNIIRMSKSRMRWTVHVTRMEEKRYACRVVVGKPEGKKPLTRSRRRWVINVKIDLRGMGWGGMDWINLAQDGVQ